MTTMLERAAAPIKAAIEAELGYLDDTAYRAIARAVLMAVKEPGDDMKESAGWSDYDSGCWAEGIDAILRENK